MKIAFILPSLQGGGAERVLLTLANGFKKRGNVVFLLLINDETVYSDEISNEIKIVNLGSKRVFFSFFGIKQFIIKEKHYFFNYSSSKYLCIANKNHSAQ